MADMFDGGVSSVFSSFDATASQPAQNGAGTGTVNVGGLSPELVPAQTVSENANLSGAGNSLAELVPSDESEDGHGGSGLPQGHGAGLRRRGRSLQP